MTDRPTEQPTDTRQSLRLVEVALPRELYRKVEALRAEHAPKLTTGDLCRRLIELAADAYGSTMADLAKADRLVVLP